jgi:hypothetical protein
MPNRRQNRRILLYSKCHIPNVRVLSGCESSVCQSSVGASVSECQFSVGASLQWVPVLVGASLQRESVLSFKGREQVRG